MSNIHPYTLIAIPCYGERVLPRFDQAHEFLLANINKHSKTINNTSKKTCPLPAQQIAPWLAAQGVNGVICSGIPQQHQLQLQQMGIWLIWGVAGEIMPQLQHWLDQQMLSTDTKHNQNVSNNSIAHCNEIPFI